MEHTRLGRTGLDVSVIGIGTEHMHGQPRETVVSTLRTAVERGVNYFDIIFAMPEYLDHCNHCLPCPVVIDIGQVNRLLDLAEFGVTASLRATYAVLPVQAPACTGCGACTKRCPFGVDVMARMQQVIATFEA
jgi:predicted aldo/keto reductase-like oxidoreductase